MTPTEFLRVADHFPDATLLLSRKGVILAANRAVSGLGFSSLKLPGQKIVDVTVTSSETVDDYLRLCSRSREPVAGSLDLVTPDGRRIKCRAYGSIAHHNPEPDKSLLLVRLILKESSPSQFAVLNHKVGELTEQIRRRRLAEESLREQREWLGVTLASIGDAVIAADAEGLIWFLNPVAEQLTGWTQKDAQRQPLEVVFRIINEYSRQPVENPAARVLREGVVVGLANHTILIAKDGTERPIDDSAAPIRGSDGRVEGVVLVFRDVTEQKSAQRVVHEQAQVLTGILGATVDHVYVIDQEGRYRFVSAGGARAFGVTPDEMTGKHWRELGLPETTMKPFDLQRDEVLRTRRPIRQEVDFADLEGSVRRYEYVIAPLTPIGGRTDTVVTVSRDITERRQAEAFLQENEAWLRLALDAGNMGTWEWDVRTGRIRWSENLEVLHGLEPGTFDGTFEAFQQLVYPDDRSTLDAALQEALAGRKTFESEFRIVRPNGEVGWMLGRGKAYFSDDGEPLRMVGVGMDVTERHRVEEELSRVSLESERRRRLYETILANTPDLAYVFDLDHRFTYANEILLKMWGKTWDEAIGKNCLELGYEPWHAELHDREIEEVVATKQPIRGEVPFAGTIGNRIYDYIFVPVIGSTGEVEAVAGTTRDVTERKREEAAARFLANASAALTDLTDPDSTLRKVARLAVPHFADWCAVDLVENGELRRVAVAHIDSAKVELAHDYHHRFPPTPSDPRGVWQILRTGRSDLVPEITDDLLNEIVNEPDRRHFLRTLGLRSYIGVALKLRDKVLGVLTFVAAESQRHYDKRDLALAEDLAQRVAIAIENAGLYREVTEAHRRKDEFLAMLAHELRNPLAPIKSGLDLLQMNGTDPDVVSLMNGQVEHLVRLVDDLLDVSRILRGRVDLQRRPVVLDEIIQRAVETVRLLLESQQQELSVNLPDGPIRLEADPVRLTQVLSNLLNNASKYTDAGGRISLAAERQEERAVVRVQDNGSGIDPQLLPHVFDLFTQSTRTIDRSQGGLGLGLTIVRNLVEMHGGSVTAKSEGIGKGSEFTVHLPLAVTQLQAEDARPEPDPITSCRILVVDDNLPAAKLLVRLIDKLGRHETVTASDGEGALIAAEAYKPDLILLDIGLPKVDGYQVAKQLRENPQFARTLLVALTGYGTDEDRRKAAEAGFDEHVTKPPSIEVLKRVLSHPKLKPAQN